MIIYLVTNKITGKQYVGQTMRSIEKRWETHGHGNYYISKSIRKHGKDNFKIEILEKCKSKQELSEKEIYWIKELNTLSPNGYNLTGGGEGNLGWKHTEEAKRKMSEAMKGKKHPNYGKKHSEEIRRKISESLKGHKYSIESRRKMSESQKGKTHSVETRSRMSKAQKGKKRSGKTCKIMSEATKGENNPMYGKKHSVATRQKMSIAKKNMSTETRKRMSEAQKRRHKLAQATDKLTK